MMRWLPIVGVGVLLAIAGIVLLVAITPGSSPSEAQRTADLAAELRCPDCQGLSVADSPTTSAREIRRQIGELVGSGATDDEVRAHFVARYGEWIRLAPSGATPWLIPFGVLAAGVLALGGWLVRRSGDVPATDPLTDAQRHAVRDEAEALDA